jgi:hypothetical protein
MKSFCESPPIEYVEVRVMVLDVRDVRDRIHEAHGAVEILELQRPLQALGIAGQRPVGMQLRAQSAGLLRRERRHAALAGCALAGREVGHGAILL